MRSTAESWISCKLTLSFPYATIAEKVGLSPAPCWRRIRRLEEDGVIVRRVALLNRR